MQAIGNVYRNLGLYDLAEPLLREALDVRRRVFGADHPAVAQSLNNLGVVLRQRGDYDRRRAAVQRGPGDAPPAPRGSRPS